MLLWTKILMIILALAILISETIVQSFKEKFRHNFLIQDDHCTPVQGDEREVGKYPKGGNYLNPCISVYLVLKWMGFCCPRVLVNI